MTNHTNPLYAEYEIEISYSIRQGMVYDEDKTRQRHLLLYMCDLHENQNWIIMIDWTWCDLSQKNRQDNNMIGRIGLISIEYNTKLSRPIWKCVIYDEDEIG